MANLIEIKKDLFRVDDKYHLAHCISADAEMGKGIAVQFKKQYKLNELYNMPLQVGSCVKIGRVFNLITKEKYWHKPTYGSFTKSIVDMKNQCVSHNVQYLAMPKIGCGLDKLQWAKVREILETEFSDCNIEILVCVL